MVSIIIPVYNTERYLDKCIQSILRQTYTSLEIIFINDGSTDHSLQILEKYQAEDDRIQIISVENGGQGRARNIGIERAKGEYIMFVDSDDWISEDCVEVLYSALVEKQCDISMGDIAKTKFEEEEIISVLNTRMPALVDKHNKKEFLFDILSYPFAQLIRKELFAEHGISFPSHYFEDVATLPLIYAVADKICYQKNTIYYYRSWSGSTVNNIKLVGDRMSCVYTLRDGLKRLGLYEEYKEEFLKFARRRRGINRRVVRELLDRQYQAYERRQLICDYEILGRCEDKTGLRACVYGSYNLMIAAKIFLRLKNEEQVPNYFGFQNIISSTSPKNKTLEAVISSLPDGNPFRKKALVQDFKKTLFHQNPEQGGIDYFILDFLEERYDVGCMGDACFTMSDAFLDVKTCMHMGFGVLTSFSPEWKWVWQERCHEFIRSVREIVGDGKILLVKMKLSERQRQRGEEALFDDASSIRQINGNLEGCYDYFIQHCPEALVVEVEHLESFFTDRQFRHGCFPWHLNEDAYREIAGEMKKAVDYQQYKELVFQEKAVPSNGV